jgi:hypothetical protein
MRVTKITVAVVVGIAVFIYGFAYIYQYVWPRKSILVCSFRDPPDEKWTRTPADPGVPFGGAAAITLPVSFRSTKDICRFFASQGLPTESKEVHGNDDSYFFLLSYPFSGLDGAEVYCFVQRTNVWVRFFQTGVVNMNRGPLAFKPSGPYIYIVQNGEVVTTLNPPPK